jgi:L,D-transpeptidase catalytic domain
MKSRTKIIAVLGLGLLLGACSSPQPNAIMTSGTAYKSHMQRHANRSYYYMPPPGQWTVGDVVQAYGANVKGKLNYYFDKAKVSYPPREVTLIALKQEKKLELWARDRGEFRFIRDYYIMAASGVVGPKLSQGDKQVPEGIYRIVQLNPNSHYYLSMKINYPNDFDLFHAGQEGRNNPGSDIYIHGKSASIGCLAIGDEAIKELFVLTAQVGASNVKVVIAPHDPRAYPLVADSENYPEWTPELYSLISREITSLSTGVKSAKTGLWLTNEHPTGEVR